MVSSRLFKAGVLTQRQHKQRQGIAIVGWVDHQVCDELRRQQRSMGSSGTRQGEDQLGSGLGKEPPRPEQRAPTVDKIC